MDITIALDVGGTGIKTGVFDLSDGSMIGEIFETPSRAMESRDIIIDNFASIVLRALANARALADSTVELKDIRMAFPNPFDYQAGTPYIKGNNKYDAIYAVNLPEAIGAATGIDCNYKFINDIKAFALGEMSDRPVLRTKRVFYLCLGTGCGSAFSTDGEVRYDVCDGKYKGGEIYDFPYKDGILDDYLSVRGLGRIAEARLGKPYSGKELYDMVRDGNADALRVFEEYGDDVYAGVTPVLEDFGAQAVVIGGNICRSYDYFGRRIGQYMSDRQIDVYFTENTSLSAMRGLLTL